MTVSTVLFCALVIFGGGCAGPLPAQGRPGHDKAPAPEEPWAERFARREINEDEHRHRPKS